ncbi:MAG: phosphate regulon transcriptional regulatory protein PhoB [Hyphomicrobiales bacterium]|nr:phosphate regulon transcriptional regulator PhoB [Hyphomicrobiales bacterium]PCH49834.1 MAG: phosphate regulon transcriptional regulatory protein PhoB [Hyphomicrobiales bacterium]
MAVKNKIKVLIVEDEPAQLELLSYNLKSEGYEIICADNGEEGCLLAQEENPELIILDWMLPKLSGIEVCRQLKRKKETREIPIMMLTARGEEADKVRGLDIGADDYIVKPYSVAELLARARALVRRANPAASGNVVEYGDIYFDAEKIKLTRGGKAIKLGPTEFRLFSIFIGRPGRVWSRDQLLERVWEHDLDIDYRTVDVHIGRLRKALRQDGKPDPIRTVRSAGYSLDYES